MCVCAGAGSRVTHCVNCVRMLRRNGTGTEHEIKLPNKFGGAYFLFLWLEMGGEEQTLGKSVFKVSNWIYLVPANELLAQIAPYRGAFSHEANDIRFVTLHSAHKRLFFLLFKLRLYNVCLLWERRMETVSDNRKRQSFTECIRSIKHLP